MELLRKSALKGGLQRLFASPQNSCDEVLTSRPSECDCIWK